MRIDPQDLAALAQVNAGVPRYVAYLKAIRDTELKVLTQNRDPVVVHRAQGAYNTLDELIKNLENANKHLAR